MNNIVDLQHKAAELRQAALRFQASAQNIRGTVANVVHTADDLSLLGYQSLAEAQWMAHYRSAHTSMNTWADTLTHFAQRLNEAADQIDTTIAEQQPHPVAHVVPVLHPGDAHSMAPAVAPPPANHALHSGETHPANGWTTLEGVYGKVKAVTLEKLHEASLPGAGQYLSAFNRQRLEQLTTEQQALALKQAQLASLSEQRNSAALTTHMLMERTATDSNPHLLATVQDAQEKLRVLDLQVKGANSEVNRLGIDVGGLSQRLALLHPDPDANTRLMLSMEGAQSPAWLKTSTFDCVRYVVSKVAVPPAIARDAYLWDDQALTLRQYGIKVGNVPMPGSVLVMERDHPYADHVHGHLMYVEKVDNGQVWITDNLHPEPVKLSALTAETSGPDIKYIYFPWQTHA